MKEPLSALKIIRLLSGIFPNELKGMADRLALVNLLSRYLEGDVEHAFVQSQIEKYNVSLERESDGTKT